MNEVRTKKTIINIPSALAAAKISVFLFYLFVLVFLLVLLKVVVLQISF
jgi:hypothetical protein